MASEAKDPGRLAVLLMAIAWAVSASLAAQSRGEAQAKEFGDTQQAAGAAVAASAADVPATANAVLEEMAEAAGVIFAGQVTAVRMPAGLAGAVEDAGQGAVEVDFRVDQAVRGPGPGTVYTLREWPGLWNVGGGGGRYRVGQRLLVFLYEPDASGLSSPVHGRDGAVPLRGGGVAPGPDDGTMAAAAQWVVDLRWVQARALRSGGLVAPPVRTPVVPRPVHGFVAGGIVLDGDDLGASRALAALKFRQVVVRPAPSPVTGSMTATAPLETEPLSQVLALCQKAMRRIDAKQ